VRILATDPASGWHRIECPVGIDYEGACWVSGSSLFAEVTTETGGPETARADLLSGAVPAEKLEFGHVYLIWIDGDESVTAFLAPPKRGPDGVVPGSE
jgi:hypothetical protein